MTRLRLSWRHIAPSEWTARRGPIGASIYRTRTGRWSWESGLVDWTHQDVMPCVTGIYTHRDRGEASTLRAAKRRALRSVADTLRCALHRRRMRT